MIQRKTKDDIIKCQFCDIILSQDEKAYLIHLKCHYYESMVIVARNQMYKGSGNWKIMFYVMVQN